MLAIAFSHNTEQYFNLLSSDVLTGVSAVNPLEFYDFLSKSEIRLN